MLFLLPLFLSLTVRECVCVCCRVWMWNDLIAFSTECAWFFIVFCALLLLLLFFVEWVLGIFLFLAKYRELMTLTITQNENIIDSIRFSSIDFIYIIINTYATHTRVALPSHRQQILWFRNHISFSLFPYFLVIILAFESQFICAFSVMKFAVVKRVSRFKCGLVLFAKTFLICWFLCRSHKDRNPTTTTTTLRCHLYDFISFCVSCWIPFFLKPNGLKEKRNECQKVYFEFDIKT